MAKYVMSVNEKKIVDSISIPQYYNEQIVPNRSGFRLISAERPSGICPFHTDTDPSFHYWKEKNIFRCFGCGVAGTVVNLHILWEKTYRNRFIDKNTAIKDLAYMYNIELEVDESGDLKVESVFDIAKRKMERKQYEVNTFDMSKLTVAGFRTFNNQVKNTISRNPYVTDEQAVKLYERLDLTLSAYLAEAKKGLDKNDGF